MSSLVIKHSLVPMVFFYIVIMVVVAAGLRMSRREARQARPGKARDQARVASASPASASPASASPASAARASSAQADAASADSGAGASLAASSADASAARRERADRRVLIKAKPGWPQLIVHYATTAVGGYLLLMAVCLIYYFGVDRIGGNFIESAVTGSALLIGLTTPVFFLMSWLTARRN
jgi:cobalamin biosynthesis Mg chelatase CobN